MSGSRVVRAVAGIGLVLALSGCWWVQPRWDAGRSNWNPGEKTLTAASVGGLTELWDTPLQPGAQSPVVYGGRLFVTTAFVDDPQGPRTSVAALDVGDGDVLWSHDVIDPDERFVLMSDPAYVDNQVVVPAYTYNPRIAEWDGGLYRLDPATGETVSGGFEPASYGSPAVVGEDLVVTRAELVAEACPTVVERVEWTYKPAVVVPMCVPPEPPLSDYTIVGDRVLWGAGTQAWGYSPACPPYPGEDPDFVGCGPDWTVDLGGRPAPPTKVDADSVLYADDSGTVSVLDVATGEIEWQAELGAASPVSQSPAVADGHIVVTSRDGRLFSLPATGCGAPLCSPEWSATLGAEPTVAPAAGGDVVYVGLANGQVKAFGTDGCVAATCPALTTVSTGSRITGGPIIQSGRVYTGSADGTITAFGLP